MSALHVLIGFVFGYGTNMFFTGRRWTGAVIAIVSALAAIGASYYK